MRQVAQVELIKVFHLDAYKWLRKNLGLSVSEANKLAQNGQIVPFNDFKMAIRFYMYLNAHFGTSARLIIDHEYDMTGCVSSGGVSIETHQENERFYKELEQEGFGYI
jgi:hypothetical protein